MLPSAHLIALLSAFLCRLSFAAERPSIVFILADDLGYMDMAANNPRTFYETPNLDYQPGQASAKATKRPARKKTR